MANKKEFTAHYLTYGRTDTWSNLAKQYDFSTGEALRSFAKRNKLKPPTVKSYGDIPNPNKQFEVSNFLDVYNSKPITTSLIDSILRKDTSKKPILTEQDTNRQTGEEVLTFKSDKPLSPSEIDELAQVDNVTRTVTRTWLKSNKDGFWTYSICTKLLEKASLESSIDYKKEFTEFLRDKVKDENIDKYQSGKELSETDNALILSLSDLHLDKKAYEEEVGENGDTETQMHRAYNAAVDLIDRATASHDISVIYLILGNDFYHANSSANTTQKGTPLDVDGRWNTSFKKGLSLSSDIIDYAKQFAFVEVITVLGNHSPEREFYLSVALEAYYRNDADVNVETVNNIRKYFRYGTSAFMLSHEFGNKAKDLPIVFALENAKDFSECKYKFILSGHVHSKQETMYSGTSEQYGIVHKVMPSMSSTDNWHHGSLYIGNQKSCIALVINSKYGDIAELIYNV